MQISKVGTRGLIFLNNAQANRARNVECNALDVGEN